MLRDNSRNPPASAVGRFNQPTDFELTNAMHVMKKCTMRNDDGTRDVKPGLEMLAAAAGVELCRLRELRATWCGAGEMQLRTTLDKFIAECRLRPNAEIRCRTLADGPAGHAPKGEK